MSYVRLNIIDQHQSISGEVHGSEGDKIVAALAAEPETVDELALAFARFNQTQDTPHLHPAPPLNQDDLLLSGRDDAAAVGHHHDSPFRWFAHFENFEPYDAGIMVVDLAARVVAVDSSYSMPSAQGEIRLFIGDHAGKKAAQPEDEKPQGDFADKQAQDVFVDYYTELFGDDEATRHIQITDSAHDDYYTEQLNIEQINKEQPNIEQINKEQVNDGDEDFLSRASSQGLTESDADPSDDYRFYVDEAALASLAALPDEPPDDISIPYRLSDDWLFVYSIPEYEGICRERRKQRLAVPPLDARAVLYGKSLLEFIARECFTARQAFAEAASAAQNQETIQVTDNDEVLIEEYKTEEMLIEANQGMLTDDRDPTEMFADNNENAESLAALNDNFEHISEAQREIISQVHAKWWATPQEDLHNQSPREVLLAKHDFIDADLHSRELQWSFTGKCPPSLSTTSKAYLYAGFGTHEIVVYYDLVRHLIDECFAYLQTQDDLALNAIIEFLEQAKTFWLAMPNRDFSGKIPSRYIELERQRIPYAMSAREAVIDEDCPLCRMSEMFDTPGFWHLDGSNMDNRFEFSFYATREEWEAEQRSWEEFNKEFERDQQARKAKLSQDKLFDQMQDDEPLIH